MRGEKITVLQYLNGKKIQFDRCRLFKGIFRAIDDMVGQKGLQCEDFKTAIKNTIHIFAREFDKVKPENKRPEGKKAEAPSFQNVVFDASKFEQEGLSYFNNRKSLNNQEPLSPFMVNRVLTSLGR